ncbi:site-specific integrase/recombinase [Sinorhizobium meliloti SM11]|uniref:Site-specific integrase/recombinase n=1 Tax=Sinorhizobium meliloti (strain SM11) TaxID=707241 RepID=F7X4A4_SINMM|nr:MULTISPECIES: site-specific integrase [Sinorhizobium]AEH79690.1 site-specific integrase/recombinase [Sinorhizobium meliloti SM11]MDE4557447.1 site-specific integrase [Sinorhizobium meliloti SM11]WQO53249.1 site-specific integrase [Sinorhizobium medicae]WQO73946.1 site-specific integrase [Sinorhizobium medicae]
MSVYKPKNSPYYHFDFQVAGVRYHGSTETANRREAEAREKIERDKAKAAAKASKNASGGPLTIAVATGRYWSEVGERHANSETTWTDINRLVDYFGPTKLLSDISDDDVAKLVQWRRSQNAWGREQTKDEKPMRLVSAATVNRSTTLVLKKIFTRAKRTWKYEFPIEPSWRDHWLQEPKERVRELKATEGAAIELATRSDFQPIFDFVRATGLRLEECILRWSEVDWQTGWITKTGKGGRMVKTAITSTVRDILLPLRGHHPEFVFTYQAARTRTGKASYKGDGEGRKKGDRYPITYSGLKTQWKRIRAKAKVEDFRFHDFRHDLATKLLRKTGNLKTVQKALSHADIKTTTRYAHVLDEEVAEALESLSRSKRAQRKNK